MSGFPETPGGESARHRRPVIADPASIEVLAGWRDPAEREEAAQVLAHELVSRQADDDALTRLIALSDRESIDTVAALWSRSQPETLGGALWRIYALVAGIRNDPDAAVRRYRAAITAEPVHEAVIGAADTPLAGDLVTVATSILAGVFTGDVDVACDRAARLAAVLAAGAAHEADALDNVAPEHAARTTFSAGSLLRTSTELSDFARSWRAGERH